jgi:HAE1 family hydrophobic/amphiphilic exporter-1
VVPKGFFPQQDTGQLTGATEAAQDISFLAMEEKQDTIVKTVMADPSVQAVGSFFGGGSGSALNSGRMFISLKPKGSGKNERKDDVGTIIARLRQKLSKIFSFNQARIFGSGAALRRRSTNTRSRIQISMS